MKKSCRIMAAGITALVIVLMTAGICAFAETEPDWKPTENKVKFAGMDYSKGMFSAAAKGTELTVNNDGTVTFNITTVPMVSTKYTKVAISSEELTDDDKREQASASIPVIVKTATDRYIGEFDDKDYGQKPYYWSEFSFTLEIESLKDPIYTSSYNVLKRVDDATKTYEENLETASWAYNSVWTVKATPELIQKLRSKQAELGESDIAARIGLIAEYFEDEYAETVRQLIKAAKADLNDKTLIEKALAACEYLTDKYKAELADDIKTLKNAKAEIERKEKEAAAKKKAIASVQAGKITGFKTVAGKKKVTFKWKKNTVFAGYQLKYKVGKKSKTLLIKNAKTVKKVVKKLKKGKKVTAQIRGYKAISGTKYYGKWAKAKTVKVK